MAEVLLFFYYSFPFVFIPFFIPNSREGNVKRQKKSCFKVPLFFFSSSTLLFSIFFNRGNFWSSSTIWAFFARSGTSRVELDFIIKKKSQKNGLLPIKGGTKIKGRGGRKNVLKRTKTNAPNVSNECITQRKVSRLSHKV